MMVKKYFKTGIKYIVLMCMLTILSTASISVVPTLTKKVIENYATFNKTVIIKYSIIYILAIALFLLFDYLRKLVMFAHHKGYAKEIKADLMDAVIKKSHVILNDGNKEFYINAILNDTETVYDNYIYCSIELVMSFVSFIVYSIYMFTINIALAIITISACLLSLFIPRIVGNKLSALELEKSIEEEELIKELNELMDGKELFSFRTAPKLVNRFEEKNNKYEDKLFKLLKYQAFSQTFSGLSLYFINIVVFVSGLILNYYSNVDISALIATLGFIDLVAIPIKDIVFEIITIKSSSKIVEKINNILLISDKKEQRSMKSNFGVSGVSLSIGGKELLKDLSITFSKGKKYAIIGENGAGKSVFLSTLSGERKADSGSLIIDGEIVDSETMQEMVYYGSKSFVFTSDVYNNVTIYGSYKENNELYSYLPKETEVVKMSYGEKSVINLARALSSECEIIILDEIFANIDKEKEMELTQILLSKDKTIILTTHNNKVDYLQMFDEVIEFKNGEIIR